MSNERYRTDDMTDPIVSGTYRELAGERTPAHLDHVVLNEARTAAQQRHRKTISWLRPAAWVTTIGLCLAIVLEVADMAQQEQAVFDPPSKDQQESIAETPASDAVDLPAAAAKSVPARQSGGADARQFKRLNQPERTSPAAIEVDSLDDADMQIIREAENRARLQTGSDEEAERSFLQAAPALDLASEAAAERNCGESETADPDTWLECILKLEKDGLHEAARVERELLKAAFPPTEQP